MALNRILRYGIGILCIICIVAVILLRLHTSSYMRPSALPKETITIGTTTVTVEIAATPQARQQGLSNRSKLAPNTGMLFVFGSPGEYGFWMKDMKFPLDLVFIDAHKTIVTIDQNVSPDTYPQAYFASKPVQYVIELPAGFVALNGIVQGGSVMLP